VDWSRALAQHHGTVYFFLVLRIAGRPCPATQVGVPGPREFLPLEISLRYETPDGTQAPIADCLAFSLERYFDFRRPVELRATSHSAVLERIRPTVSEVCQTHLSALLRRLRSEGSLTLHR